MCGIAGYFAPHSKEVGRALLEAQLDSLRHRGPDGEGIYQHQSVGLGHVRLAVLDLPGGRQPMERDGLVITFNGEIYNHRELRQQLLARGHRFNSQTDTEVVLRAYREWGDPFVEKLNGMFAFAIYDEDNGRLFCARDAFGQKPLYYRFCDEGFYFASELEALTFTPGFERKIDEKSVCGYLSFQSFYGGRTIYSEIQKLPPGHVLAVDAKSSLPRVSRYFHGLERRQEIPVSVAIDELDEKLRNAVADVSRSDVPFAVLLSGGLDSSLMLAMLRKLEPRREIHTYHLQVGEDSFDESRFAARVAAHFETKHHVLRLEPDELVASASELALRLDEPQGDPGILCRYLLCKEIGKEFKVALSGDGADELFYGYPTFQAAALTTHYEKLPGFVRERWIPSALRNVSAGGGYLPLGLLARRFVDGFTGEAALRNYRWTCPFTESELKGLLSNSWSLKEEFGFQMLRELYEEARELEPIRQVAHPYQKTFLPDYILCNSDRAGMLSSVELRTPYLDLDVAKFANSLPDNYKIRGWTRKWIMKKLAERYLPKNLIYRRKNGFVAPLSPLRGLFQKSLEPKKTSRLFQAQGIAKLRAELESATSLRKYWTLFSLEAWIGARTTADIPPSPHPS